MTTTADYKAMITTEVRVSVSLSQITEEDIVSIIGKSHRNLKTYDKGSNTCCLWDPKSLSIHIRGEPKAVKRVSTFIMKQVAKFASAYGTTAPETMVNLLGKEYTDGVYFCKLTDAIVASDGGAIQNDGGTDIKSIKARPAAFVAHPIAMTYEERERGRIMASELWGNARFVTWSFKDNVIKDTSMVLRSQLKKLARGEGNYLKLEMDIGKVIFLENEPKLFSLQNVKFAIPEFRHLRFDKEIKSQFREEWEGSWIEQLWSTLPTLGYQRDGCVTKQVKIYHTAQREDGKCYEAVWSADMLEGRMLGDANPGTLEFLKARVRENNPFSTTIYGPATAFDFRFSIIVNTRESTRQNREIEARVRTACRYSVQRGLLINRTYESSKGYKPLISPRARLVLETVWMRGNIKVIINEIQDGLETTFGVKIQSNLLKNYTREESREVPLSDMIEAVKELIEAAEEINGKLNLLTAELPSIGFPELPETLEKNTDDVYSTSSESLDTMLRLGMNGACGILGSSRESPPKSSPEKTLPFQAAKTEVRVRSDERVPQLSSSIDSEDDTSEKDLLFPLGSPFKHASFGIQQEELTSPTLPDSPTIGSFGNAAFGGSQEFNFRIPVPRPTKQTAQKSYTKERTLLDYRGKGEVKQSNGQKLIITTTITPSVSSNSDTVNHNVAYGKQFLTAKLTDPLPPHLHSVIKSPSDSSVAVRDSSHSHSNLLDRFFDLHGPTAGVGYNPVASVFTPRGFVSPRPESTKIDFFGGEEPLNGDDSRDLLSWSPDHDAFSYIHESDSEDIESMEGISLLD